LISIRELLRFYRKEIEFLKENYEVKQVLINQMY